MKILNQNVIYIYDMYIYDMYIYIYIYIYEGGGYLIID